MVQVKTTCRTCQELGTDYLIAVDRAEEATHRLHCSVTVTQQEDAATRLSRIQGHKLYAMGELLAHCDREGCPLPVADPVLAELFVTRLFTTLEAGAPASEEETAA